MFTYDRAITARFPTIRGGIVHATGLANGPASPALLEEYVAEQQETIDRIGATPLAEIPSLAAWRRVFSGFGVKPTQYRSAAEALLRRLSKHGDIPSINALVDIGNLVAIRHAMPVAFFDQRDVVGATTVRFADGSEMFTDLGSTEPVSPSPGEVIFVDDSGVVSARRWCWRQSEQSATKEGTTEALITVEGHHEGADDDVSAAISDLLDLLARHQPGGRWESAQLSPTDPGFPQT